MEKQIYDETNGLWYERQGDYYLPCLAIPEHRPIGVWGERHRRYLRENKHALYSGLLISGKLDSYLADIDRRAESMFARLMKEMAQREGVTEELKAADQMAWVQRDEWYPATGDGDCLRKNNCRNIFKDKYPIQEG